jgi:hypothetical protein
MVLKATRCAAEDGLRAPRGRVDATACAARLARGDGGHLDEPPTRPRELVAEHLCEARPSRVRDAARAPTSNHPRDVQFFQHDDAVALGESYRLDMQEVVALPPHLAVNASNATLGFLSVLGSFLASTDGALSVSEPLERGFEVLRVGDHVAFGGGSEVRDAAVDGDDGSLAGRGLDDVQLADDACEPRVAVPREGTGLRLAIEGAMHHGAQRAQLGEPDPRAVDSPCLRVRLAEAERVTSSTLAPGGPSEFGETSLPGSVQFHQELRAHVARDVGEPRPLGTQLGQFVDRVEGRRVAALVSRSGEPHAPLLKRQVPEKPQCALPRIEPRDLRRRRVDTESERLADPHSPDPSWVYSRQRLPYGQTRSLRIVGSLGLRTQVPQEGHHRACLRGAEVLGDYVLEIRVRSSRDRMGERPRASARGLSAQGRVVGAGPFAQGSVGAPAWWRALPGGRTQALGATLLESELLRGVLRRSPARDRQALRRATARRGFLPALNGAVSAPEIR